MTSLPPRVRPGAYLAGLAADADRLAAALRAIDPSRRRRAARDHDAEAIRASLLLDGADPPADRGAAWLDTLGPLDATSSDPSQMLDADPSQMLDVDEPTTSRDELVRRLQARGVATALAADDLAQALLTDLPTTLGELHARLTRGLVDPARTGRSRTADLAVHDGSVGRMVYLPVPATTIDRELDALGSWLADAGRDHHGLVTSGVVHLELLRIHPFHAANGRLARATGRLLLRAAGLDPVGSAGPEPTLASDRWGYHVEVASTLRRRDATIGVERWSEAVAAGLRAGLRSVDDVEVTVPDRARRFLAGRDATGFTIADYRAEAAADPAVADRDLTALLDAGLVERQPGARGLRFFVPDPALAPGRRLAPGQGLAPDAPRT
jgi:hypothetical protein